MHVQVERWERKHPGGVKEWQSRRYVRTYVHLYAHVSSHVRHCETVSISLSPSIAAILSLCGFHSVLTLPIPHCPLVQEVWVPGILWEASLWVQTFFFKQAGHIWSLRGWCTPCTDHLLGGHYMLSATLDIAWATAWWEWSDWYTCSGGGTIVLSHFLSLCM